MKEERTFGFPTDIFRPEETSKQACLGATKPIHERLCTFLNAFGMALTCIQEFKSISEFQSLNAGISEGFGGPFWYEYDISERWNFLSGLNVGVNDVVVV